MLNTAHENNPFLLNFPGNPRGVLEKLCQSSCDTLAKLVGLHQCADLYAELSERERCGNFAEVALAKLGVGWSVDGQGLKAVPEQGATIVVANHPYGGLEGLVLLAALRRVRADVKVLANDILWRVPELRESLIPVDPFETRRSKQKNIVPLRQALHWLKQGGLVVVFPAGEVSHFHLRSGMVTDPAWHTGVVRLAQRSGAAVLPVYFPGRNGLAFQVSGLLHPRLRTLLLARQLLNKRGKMIAARIGQSVSARRLKQIGSTEAIINYLRLRTYLLSEQDPNCQSPVVISGCPHQRALAPLVSPVPASDLSDEISHLPDECLLLENETQQVFCMTADQAPSIMREVGRLREMTFREHGEGTGRSLDIDRFDAHYRHLFIWNREQRHIVGAYRIGLTDEILLEQGLEGLYASTLFKINSDLFEELPPALEMGRSFVRPEYQRSFTPLLMLWQGIGRFLVRHPHYRVLFGPVSISRDYTEFSRGLMTHTLQAHLRLPELSRYVAPRVPVASRMPKVKGCPTESAEIFARNIETMSALVADVEADLKGIPVLLRHYMNLGGKILAFNLDRSFSDVIDGLIMVDLDQADRKSLARYLGKEGLAKYLTQNARAA